MNLMSIAKDISGCTECSLHKKRQNTVPGTGPATARIVLVGEAPGQHEDEEGKPFVGASGGLLDLFMKKAGIHRNEVFVTNILKCRPPRDRDPEAPEIVSCTTHLRTQMEAINPEVVITLGQYATTYVTCHFGQMKILMKANLVSVVTPRRIPVVPIYHPNFLLRISEQDTEFRKLTFQDTLDRLRQAKLLSEGEVTP